jgi:hypothetical protein
MVQNIFAVFSLMIGTAGLLLTYAGHRQKVRQDARDTVLRAEELRRVERDREREREEQERAARAQQEREASVRREKDRYQASMVGGHIGLSPSSLNDDWVVPQVVLHNGSNQPVRDVRAFLQDEVVGEVRLLGSDHQIVPLPAVQVSNEGYGQLGQVTVEFTDIAGIRWRREGYGHLRRARQDTEGHEVWGGLEPPVVERHASEAEPSEWSLYLPRSEAPDWSYELPAPAPPAGRRFRHLSPVAVLVSVALIAVGIWWLLH